ncbi:hypothetical protein M731_08265 [Neisseria gonorrhoeae ATL_2011_01-25]|nr:hypothetical protein M731_08265 [Neisseria gonorrhoeae ATL_2011_01-25]KLS24435.1 hypothetical protein M737_08670 [Neisseria gonorrhoeae MIA_2011_05-10]KLS47158.1 hypothetical protein M730_11340 [Neisseria gonorrhoeae ATL_2011_01-21]
MIKSALKHIVQRKTGWEWQNPETNIFQSVQTKNTNRRLVFLNFWRGGRGSNPRPPA